VKARFVSRATLRVCVPQRSVTDLAAGEHFTLARKSNGSLSA